MTDTTGMTFRRVHIFFRANFTTSFTKLLVLKGKSISNETMSLSIDNNNNIEFNLEVNRIDYWKKNLN